MLGRWKLGMLAAGALAGAASCATIAGLGDYQSGNPPSEDASVADAAAGPDAPFDAGIDVPQLAPCGEGFVCFVTEDGWEGPFQIAELPTGSDAGSPPACPGSTSYRDRGVLANLDVPDASCSCTCSVQATCSATITMSGNGACTGSCGTITKGGCTSVACNNNGTVSAIATDAAPSSCQSSPQGVPPDASFGTSASSCEAVTVDSGACEAGTVCAATPGSGFASGLCIRKQGDYPCPSPSPYAFPHVYYQNLFDDRSCGGCGCTVTQEATCNYSLTLWSTACNSGGQGQLSVSTPGTCTPQPVSSAIRAVTANFPQPANSGTCAAEGGTVEGEAGADPSGAVTYCCTQ